MSVDSTPVRRPRRTHREVADELRARIRSGRLRPGDRMPTQARLADEFGVERGVVREALRLLQADHLLTNVSKGSPATVAAGPGTVPGSYAGPLGPDVPAGLPLPTTVALGPRITAAFDGPEVSVDALCLTGISLTMAMSEAVRQIHVGRLEPARVALRVLLPSRSIPLAFPAPVDPGEDGVLQRNWLAQRDAQVRVLRHNLLALRATHGVEVSAEFRALPFTPPVKLYLLNGTEALFAYYTLDRREVEVGRRHLETYDATGTRSALFAFSGEGGVRDASFVRQSALWFGSLWSTISTPLVLDE
ncbi:FadR/GntR family transcriptional regulator [Streptomyces sp. NPDC060194]|uniref:FadR/GntR family transcriptional regulator n=1 Tax=Streptomyces sp. NPDC060194 TaxID=3347069 RepID=UPI0036499965